MEGLAWPFLAWPGGSPGDLFGTPGGGALARLFQNPFQALRGPILEPQHI